MPDPIYARHKVVLAKIEATYGTDANPTGAANAMQTTEFTFTPMEGQDVSRDLVRPYMGGQPSTPVDLHCKMSFKVELQGSGTAGTAPAWGPLLRACGCAETITANTSVVYNPISDDFEAVTVYFHQGGTLYQVLGTRGTGKVEVSASGIPYLTFELTGLYTTPGEAVRPTPDFSAYQKPDPATNANTPTFTLGGTSLVLRSLMLDFGNAVEGRFLIRSEGVVITDRQEAIETTVEAVPMTTLNPYQLAEDQTDLALALVHGTAAGKTIRLDVPAAQMQRPQGLSEAQGIVEWPLRLVPQPVSGNDQFTLTLT